MADRLDIKTAAWAGIAAGAVFIIVEMLLVAFIGGDSPWAPPRMMAAIALGDGVLPPPATFDFDIVAAAMAVHLVLAVVYGIVLGWIVAATGARLGVAVFIGLLFGIALYLVNFYGFTEIFPWFAMARNWMSIFAHALFGIVLAAVYVRMASPRAPGVEAAA